MFRVDGIREFNNKTKNTATQNAKNIQNEISRAGITPTFFSHSFSSFIQQTPTGFECSFENSESLLETRRSHILRSAVLLGPKYAPRLPPFKSTGTLLLAPGRVRQIDTGTGSDSGRRAALPVLLVRLLEHVLALQLGVEPGADEERAAHLAVQRVRLLRGRGEPVLQHHGDQVVDPLGGGLGAEVEGLVRREGLAEDHHRVHVGVYHCLTTNTIANTSTSTSRK